MKYDLNINSNKKIGIFTDIHCGVEKDSTERLQETMICFNWINETFKKNNVDYIIFLGDLFDSRFSINTKTLNTAVAGIDLLSKNFEKVFIILGNHDSYYKNTNDVNSVDFLQNITSTNNVHIISKKPMYLNICTKTLGLYPWAAEQLLLEENNNIETCDYAFGHFEANGFVQPGGISSGGKTNLNDLYKFGDYIFSGHYHINKLYKSVSKKYNALQMVGSPLQINWSDYNLKKYIYTLNLFDGNIESFENNVNAIYNKVYYSKLEKNEYSNNDLVNICDNNYIKLIIDTKYEFNKILEFLNILKQFKIRSIETEYLISLTSNIINEASNNIEKSENKSNLDYILDYIDNIFLDISKIDGDINKETLKNLASEYFNKTLVSKN